MLVLSDHRTHYSIEETTSGFCLIHKGLPEWVSSYVLGCFFSPAALPEGFISTPGIKPGVDKSLYQGCLTHFTSWAIDTLNLSGLDQ